VSDITARSRRPSIADMKKATEAASFPLFNS